MDKKELNMLLLKVSMSHRRRSAYEFMKHDLSAGQPRMLNYIFYNNGCIQREIAKACNLEPASVTSVLNSMEKAGLVTRTPVKGDKRALEVRLTDKGFEEKKVVDKIFEEIENECFKNFTEKEKEIAKDFLTRIHQNILDAEQKAVTNNAETI
jgi:DNA-binding MarR family transcriptional regulator